MVDLFSETGVVLFVIFILLASIYLLILFILSIRIFEQIKEKRENNFIKRWEEKIFEYLMDGQRPQEIIKLFPKSSYRLLLQNLRSYLVTLKGSDWEKLAELINKTELYDYLVEQLKSDQKRNIVFGAYYLGLAKSEDAKLLIREKLKHSNKMVFLSCALSLARMNEIYSLDEIFNQAEKFEDLSRETLLNILLEYKEPVCEQLLHRLQNEKSLTIISVIVTALRRFRYTPAAPTILQILLKGESNTIVLESLRYFGDIEYLDASDELESYLKSSDAETRFEAIHAAARIGRKELEKSVWELIFDEDHHVKTAAAEAAYSYSNKSNKKLKKLALSNPETIESLVAKMIISEKTIHQN